MAQALIQERKFYIAQRKEGQSIVTELMYPGGNVRKVAAVHESLIQSQKDMDSYNETIGLMIRRLLEAASKDCPVGPGRSQKLNTVKRKEGYLQ